MFELFVIFLLVYGVYFGVAGLAYSVKSTLSYVGVEQSDKTTTFYHLLDYVTFHVGLTFIGILSVSMIVAISIGIAKLFI